MNKAFDNWYKYAAISVTVILSTVIATISTVGYLKTSIRDAVTSAIEPIKKDVSVLQNQVEKLIPTLSQQQTALALLTYRINSVEESCGRKVFIKPEEPKREEYEEYEEPKPEDNKRETEK